MTDTTAKLAPAPPAAAAPGPWAPLSQPVFRWLWLATVVSNVGTWMQDVGSGWLMAELAPSPLMVSLVQAATTLPIFLFALPAGALADILDRRKLLLWVQSALLLLSAALGLLASAGLVGPWLLLGFTFAAGVGAALLAPAWQAIVPELVPKPNLPAALALNSLGINIARAIGPAAGGLSIAALGIGAPFLLNAASFIFVIAALLLWKRQEPARRLPPEGLAAAVRTGLRYAGASPPLQAVLVRAAAFFLCASAAWAFLPLVARDQLGGGPTLYGILLGCMGAGAILGALLLPKLRAKLGLDGLVRAGTVTLAIAMVGLSLSGTALAAGLVLLLAGMAWIGVVSSLNLAAQGALPAWVRARGLAVYLMVFYGGMTGGSLLWGQVAALAGIGTALQAAAAGAVLLAVLSRPWALNRAEGLDLAPSLHWPAPALAQEVEHDRGPVLVTIEYRVDPANAESFAQAMQALSAERWRDGALSWGLYQDAADPWLWLESFTAASWLDHLRQHERVTKADQDIQSKARAFHVGAEPPVVRHLLAPVAKA